MSGLSAPIRAYAPMHYSGAAAPFSFASFWGNRPETVSQTTHIKAVLFLDRPKAAVI